MTTFESLLFTAIFAVTTGFFFFLSSVEPRFFYIGMIAALFTVICIYAAITKEN